MGRCRWSSGPRVWLGIGLDAPEIAPADLLRFDASLAIAKPFACEARVECRRIEGGPHAMTTHVGPLETLPAAYAAIFGRLGSITGYRAVGLPVIELYRTASLGSLGTVEQTDIYLPLERIWGGAP